MRNIAEQKPPPIAKLPKKTDSSVMDSQLLCQNIDEEGSWTVSMKLHRNDANFSEALQQEKEAQREAMMLVSQSLSPSPKNKLKISVKSNEEEKESQDEESAGGKTPKKQSTE